MLHVENTGRPRRRGEQLRAAICQAVVEELQEHGFAALTMDAVATRAQAGKATLYRHWSNKLDLVVDALQYTEPQYDVPPDSGDLRAELIDVLRQHTDDLSGPSGAAARGMIAEIVRNPELARVLKPHLVDPVIAPTLEVLRRAAVRGEVPVAALTPRVAGVGTDLLRQHILIYGTPVADGILSEIVDQVVLPLLRGHAVDPA